MTTPTVARDRTRATGADLRAALQAAATWLLANAERINALNVFPVPDGDTGTNMSMTLQAAIEDLARLDDDVSVGQVARTAYEAAMLGARGNSGVILSQLLRGFAEALAVADDLTPHALAEALHLAGEVAFRAVSKPAEGTILTVARAVGVAARAAAGAGADLPELLGQSARAATDAVAATPQQLEVLRKAGVVDAGGEGYRVILEGAWMWSTGRSVDEDATTHPYSRALVDAIEEDSTFGFCTEYLLREVNVEVSEVKAQMEALGESVLAVGDQSLMRVHVHTLRPGQALEYAVEHGTVVRVKVENMQLQHEAFAAEARGAGDRDTSPASTIGVIAVGAGEGLLKVFRSLGATVVQGGQTMNPSVQEILNAVNRSGYRELIILPNNSNIVMTARHVQELTPHAVEVVPTETVPQGIGALLAFNFQADMQTNVVAMQQAAHAVHTIEVTRAVRDAEVDGRRVRSGQYLAIVDGKVSSAGDTAEGVLLSALSSTVVEEMEIVTIYYGEGFTEAQAQTVAARVRDLHSGLAVEVVEGGQPHYPYIASLE
ncbi:MAG: DAK2 domain-containing protein [Chloroflexi bacterium]|nr:DAK2 domain-containing protein [Chloroflexota bacterium]